MVRRVHTIDRSRSQSKALLATALVVGAVMAGCSSGEHGFDVVTMNDAAGLDAGPRWSGLAPPSGLYQCAADFESRVDTAVIDSHAPGAAVHIDVRVHDPGYVDPNWTHPLHVALVRGDTELRVLADRPNATPESSVSATWDGTVSGTPAAVGSYAIRTSYRCQPGGMPVVRDLPIAVVRVGVVAVGVGDGDGARLPLLWHRLDHVTRNYWMPPNARAVLVRGAGHGVTDLDLPSGTPRPFPAVWTDLESPPVDATGEPVTSDYSLPFAVAAASHPDVTLTFGYAAPAPSTTAPLHVRATLTEGTVAQNALLTDGGSATFRMTTLPAPMVGRYDVSLHVAFEYDRGDGTWGPIATEAVPLRAYGLLGAQTIQINTTAPYAAWVAVADAVAGWIDGSTADPQRVAGQIVHHVYDDLGLHYDTVHGASYYTTYRTGYSGANFDLSAFLERANGTTVNCTDCASIVSTYANMIGCDLGYNIITSNFPLDYIHAIGTPAFTDDPFNTGRPGGFHYHAITSDGDGLVFDATLHEDGDSAPGAPPFEETVIDGLMQDFYLGHLTPAMVLVSHDDKTAIE